MWNILLEIYAISSIIAMATCHFVFPRKTGLAALVILICLFPAVNSLVALTGIVIIVESVLETMMKSLTE
jgi:ABC-type maltose transport system permease subunit